MLGYPLGEIHRELRARVSEFVEKEVVPAARRADERQEFPRGNWDVLAEMGLTGTLVPQDAGGSGLGLTGMAVVAEELARANAGLAQSYQAHEALVTGPLFRFGTPEQKSRFLLSLARGHMIGACAISEPGAGSDVVSIETEAVRDGNEWSIKGKKRFVTNGGIADIYIVLAYTDRSKKHRGISAFLVEKDVPGLRLAKDISTLGLRSSPHAGLILEDCRVPLDNLLGEEGGGFRIAMTGLDMARVGWSAISLGIARAALDRSVEFARRHHQFGQPIAEFQGIQWMLAEAAIQVEAANLMTYAPAHLADQGEPFSEKAAMGKAFSSRQAVEVTRTAIQIHGGQGYLDSSDLTRYYRDAKACEIVGGTTEIQKIVIARSLLR